MQPRAPQAGRRGCGRGQGVQLGPGALPPLRPLRPPPCPRQSPHLTCSLLYLCFTSRRIYPHRAWQACLSPPPPPPPAGWTPGTLGAPGSLLGQWAHRPAAAAQNTASSTWSPRLGRTTETRPPRSPRGAHMAGTCPVPQPTPPACHPPACRPTSQPPGPGDPAASTCDNRQACSLQRRAGTSTPGQTGVTVTSELPPRPTQTAGGSQPRPPRARPGPRGKLLKRAHRQVSYRPPPASPSPVLRLHPQA